MTSAVTTAHSERPRPDVVEKYRSLFVIGEGGMGSVEVALERAGTEFERIVALKRMLPAAARDKRHIDMFLREARLAALLSHPNVVHAFDFGEAKGELYLAMEYVEGEPLSRVVERAFAQEGRLAPTLVAHILAEICDGLHAAHELRDVNGKTLNVVHRDVSPHNVMVAYEGHVKLLDFGVAKMEDDRGVTRTGEVKGKTGYMSPEQAMGDPLDRRSDLYAVGAVLFECLAGRRMWIGTDMEVIRQLALEEPPRLDAVTPGTPSRLVELHARLVARDRSKRPATARDVADELRAYIAETGTRPDTRVMRAVMTRLFRDEEERRKAKLTSALTTVVAPSRAATLRASLGHMTPLPPHLLATMDLPPALSASSNAASSSASTSSSSSGGARAVFARPDLTPMTTRDEDARDSTSAFIAPTPLLPRSRVVVVVAALALLMGVGIATGAMLRRVPGDSPATASSSPAPKTSAIAAASQAPTSITPAPPVTTPPAPLHPVTSTIAAPVDKPSTPRPRGGGRQKPAPAAPTTPSVTPPVTPAQPPPPPTAKPLDVDPNAVP